MPFMATVVAPFPAKSDRADGGQQVAPSRSFVEEAEAPRGQGELQVERAKKNLGGARGSKDPDLFAA